MYPRANFPSEPANPMERKPPRRTRERILALSLQLFNDFGEPNVTTSNIAEEMNISPGNLYYHFRNKDDIINCLFSDFEKEMEGILGSPPAQASVEDAWFFLHTLYEIIWRYRFFYRDLNNLLANNRTVETQFRRILAQSADVTRKLCEGLRASGELKADDRELDALTTNIVVVATYWLSYEYVLNPRQFNDQAKMSEALSRGVYHTFTLVAPYLTGDSRALFAKLAGEYMK
ncbi:MAG TPA: TetR/AcrR family transcriptional regulator [Burkholderiaceae bacterium]|nr:TetR/AcrR family transcriptional regulator [Burkholderiaceae bacterium]